MDGPVLIVDDDHHILESLDRALTNAGFDVRTAPGAAEALAEIARRPPGVALIDLKLPGTGKMDLLRMLGERTPALDVVMMTAYDDLPTIAEAMREGAVDFLVKPLDLTHPRRLLERSCSARGGASARARDRQRPRVSGRGPLGRRSSATPRIFVRAIRTTFVPPAPAHLPKPNPGQFCFRTASGIWKTALTGAGRVSTKTLQDGVNDAHIQ